jgi:hypothetical protein
VNDRQSPEPINDRYRKKCIDCGDPAWDTYRFLCRWCYRWRLIDLNAARVT